MLVAFLLRAHAWFVSANGVLGTACLSLRNDAARKRKSCLPPQDERHWDGSYWDCAALAWNKFEDIVLALGFRVGKSANTIYPHTASYVDS